MFNIKKRNNSLETFESQKIIVAINKAFFSVNEEPNPKVIADIAEKIKAIALENSKLDKPLSVEEIQDLVEVELIDLHCHSVLKSYILYRNKRQHLRHVINDYQKLGYSDKVLEILGDINANYDQNGYNIEHLYHKTLSFHKPNLNEEKKLDILIKASLELTSKEFPDWEYISARFLNVKIRKEILKNNGHLEKTSFYNKLKYYTKGKLYGEYILENYSENEVNELEEYLENSRDNLFTYSALNLLYKRYLAKTFNNEVIETTQEMFMGIAMHLAIPEKNNRLEFVKNLYDILSKLKVTMATPTMSNSRKPHHQLSSCFIDTVDDSLAGIYKSINNFAQVSKAGGGMGMYFGKVRANGSDIRDFKGVAGGVIRWIKLANDTAIAVDQLGVRQGSVAVYLDAWHKDILEFLQLKTNNGDDRQKAHDVFPAICYPDLFWKLAKEDINATWYMMCPHEVLKVKGYAIEDYYGKEWEEKYYDCVNDDRIEKREVVVKDLVRLIIKSAVETGTPFTFNRDAVNRANPNKHQGIIYSSNLCTEIMQNMKPITNIKTETKTINGETVVVETSTPGDFVVCNLASIVLGNIDVENDQELKYVISTVTRALDNVIELNYYPVEYAGITNRKYRAIGLGASGYHHMLVKKGLKWESEEHLDFVDKLFEKINYYAIEASNEIALEKGSYSCFKGSDWENGDYFTTRNYNSKKWLELKEKVKENGLRNGYLLAVAPTGSTSIIAGTTAGTDPIMNKYFLEEKKGDIVPRVAPGLNSKTFWLYKSAHNIDQQWSIKAAARRQRHIDQSQSFNIYVTNENTMRQILNMYINACELGVKTIYYFRSKSLEVAECDSCSA